MTKRFDKILPTIRSRATHLKFKAYTQDSLKQIEQIEQTFQNYPFERYYERLNQKSNINDIDQLNQIELIEYIDHLKRKLNFFSIIGQEKIKYLNEMKIGLQYFNLNIENAKDSLKIIEKKLT